jgi:hypothetical protein
MLIINLQNVRDLIVKDKKATSLLPEFKIFFDTWKFSLLSSTFKSLGEKALMDFLLALKPKHIEILEKYFNDSISINTVDYRVVKNRNFPLNKVEEFQMDGYPYFSIYRDNSDLYITYWR